MTQAWNDEQSAGHERMKARPQEGRERMFSNWGPGEVLLVLVVVFLLFGAKRLPDLARSLGRSLSEFKKGKLEAEQEVEAMRDAAKASPAKKQDDEEAKRNP